MIQRMRDKKVFRKPLEHVTPEKWAEISDRAAFAHSFFNEENMLYSILQQDFQNAHDTLVENRILEVREESTLTDTFKRIFIKPRKIQVDELTGQYRYIKDLFAQLNLWITVKEDYEKLEALGQVTIQRNDRS